MANKRPGVIASVVMVIFGLGLMSTCHRAVFGDADDAPRVRVTVSRDDPTLLPETAPECALTGIASLTWPTFNVIQARLNTCRAVMVTFTSGNVVRFNAPTL